MIFVLQLKKLLRSYVVAGNARRKDLVTKWQYLLQLRCIYMMYSSGHLKFTAFNSSNLYDELMTVNFHENRVVLPNKTNCSTKRWSNSMEKMLRKELSLLDTEEEPKGDL